MPRIARVVGPGLPHHITQRGNRRGHLWQGRFSSCPLDEAYLLAAARYVERNPLKAGIVKSVEEYPWSSARHYLRIHSDPLIQRSPLLDMVDDWKVFLAYDLDERKKSEIQRAERTGRPLGSMDFVQKLEGMLGRDLQRRKPGPKSGRN